MPSMVQESSSYYEESSSHSPPAVEVDTSPEEMRDAEMKGDEKNGDGGKGDGKKEEEEVKAVDPLPPPPPPPRAPLRLKEAPKASAARNRPQKKQCKLCFKWINDDENSAWQHLNWGTCKERQEKYGANASQKLQAFEADDGDGDADARVHGKRAKVVDVDDGGSAPWTMVKEPKKTKLLLRREHQTRSREDSSRRRLNFVQA